MSNSILTKSAGVYVAAQVKESLGETSNTKLYLGFSKVVPWDDDNNPPVANTSVGTTYEIWKTLIAGKRITENDLEHVVPRIRWQNNYPYDIYDDKDTDLYSKEFYVLTNDFNVYKCLSNNNGANSTVEPTSTNPVSVTQTSDGYIWKYMYTLNSEDQYRFLNDNYFPVRLVTSNDGSQQYQVQQNAIEGAIYNIVIENAGNYANSDNLSIVIEGDGSAANAFANVNLSSGEIHTITIDDFGLGYTYCTAYVTGGGGTGGATLRPIISPTGGHGSNALDELGGSNIMVNVRIRGSEGGLIPIVNELRTTAVIQDPLDYTGDDLYGNSVFNQTTTLTVTGQTGDYSEDEFVYQGSSLLSASFSGRVVEWDSANSKIKLNNVEGGATADTLIGDSTGVSGFVTSFLNPDLQSYSGRILYVNNISEISRNEFQTENYRIVLKF